MYVFFKNVNVIKDKERPRNYSRLKETQEV